MIMENIEEYIEKDQSILANEIVKKHNIGQDMACAIAPFIIEAWFEWLRSGAEDYNPEVTVKRLVDANIINQSEMETYAVICKDAFNIYDYSACVIY